MNPLTAAIYIINWFCRCYSTPSVHTLVIDEMTVFYRPTMCNFIRHLGSALENLTISCSFFLNQNVSVFCTFFVDSSLIITLLTVALSKQLDLSQNISLRNISFDSVILYADSLRTRSWTWMMSIIFSYHSSFIRACKTITRQNRSMHLSSPLSAHLFLSQPLYLIIRLN
jgi:hypothetical protein